MHPAELLGLHILQAEMKQGTCCFCTPAGQPHKQQLPDECKLYVGNLPPAYDSAMLRQLFEPHARVVHSAVITEPGTGMSRGFGFIHIPDAQQVRSSSNWDCCVVEYCVVASTRLRFVHDCHASQTSSISTSSSDGLQIL
jgi:hypothetical protein